MDAAIILVLSLTPGLFWTWYFFKKDRVEPEPLRLIRDCFLLGMVAVIPAAILEPPFERISVLFSVVVAAPIMEELLKFAVVRLTVFRKTEFNEPMDGIVYAAAAALGFASLENVLYVLGEYNKGTGTVAAVTVLRALLSVPGHALWSSMWGFALGFAKFAPPLRRKKLIRTGLLMAIGMHGLYNLLCLSGPVWPLGLLIFVPVTWMIAHRRIEQALLASPHNSTGEGEDYSSRRPHREDRSNSS